MKRAAVFLVATALAASLAACSSDDNADKSTASDPATSAAAKLPSLAPVEPNLDLACGRYYNGGDGSLRAQVAAAVPVMEAQDSGTALTDDQVAQLQAIDSQLVLAVKIAPEELAGAYEQIQARIEGALAAADSGGKNTATLDFPATTKTIESACADAGFSAS